jgi:streptomycin 6-kinase
LTVAGPFPPTPGTPGNFVAPAITAHGSRVVLKISHHRQETRNEIAALRLWAGNGVARLLAADADLGAILLERVLPGTMLAEVADDDETVRVTASVLRQLWLPLPPENGLQSLETWTRAYERNRDALNAGAGSFPRALFQRADALRSELLATTTAPVALHGDMHHFNVLRSDRAGWLAIDPKGLAGDRHFDVCQFLMNPVPVSAPVNRHRLDLFSAELDLDRKRLSQWALLHAVLNACWSFEENRDWRSAVAYAEETLSL